MCNNFFGFDIVTDNCEKYKFYVIIGETIKRGKLHLYRYIHICGFKHITFTTFVIANEQKVIRGCVYANLCCP